MGHVYLKSHYKVDPLLELDNLKDIMDKECRFLEPEVTWFKCIPKAWLVVAANAGSHDPVRVL
jgi:hypothetical protein